MELCFSRSVLPFYTIISRAVYAGLKAAWVFNSISSSELIYRAFWWSTLVIHCRSLCDIPHTRAFFQLPGVVLKENVSITRYLWWWDLQNGPAGLSGAAGQRSLRRCLHQPKPLVVNWYKPCHSDNVNQTWRCSSSPKWHFYTGKKYKQDNWMIYCGDRIFKVEYINIFDETTFFHIIPSQCCRTGRHSSDTIRQLVSSGLEWVAGTNTIQALPGRK